MAQLAHSGPFTRLKEKLMNLTAPLWRRYWNTQPRILIDSRLMTLSAAAADQTGLGAPVATNTDGMRAWILSPAEFSSFLQRLNTTPDASLVSRPRAQTAAGTSARTFFGNTVLVAGKNVPIGLTLDLSPKVRATRGSPSPRPSPMGEGGWSTASRSHPFRSLPNIHCPNTNQTPAVPSP